MISYKQRQVINSKKFQKTNENWDFSNNRAKEISINELLIKDETAWKASCETLSRRLFIAMKNLRLLKKDFDKQKSKNEIRKSLDEFIITNFLE